MTFDLILKIVGQKITSYDVKDDDCYLESEPDAPVKADKDYYSDNRLGKSTQLGFSVPAGTNNFYDYKNNDAVSTSQVSNARKSIMILDDLGLAKKSQKKEKVNKQLEIGKLVLNF